MNTSFESNYVAIDRGKAVRNNSFQILFLVIPFFGLLIFSLYLVNINIKEAQVFVLVVLAPFMLALVVFFVFITLLMMKRWNRTITKIGFENNKSYITTFPVLWLTSKYFDLPISSISFSKRNFSWYSKEGKEGLMLRIGDGKDELYLIKDYFDDYESISRDLAGQV